MRCTGMVIVLLAILPTVSAATVTVAVDGREATLSAIQDDNSTMEAKFVGDTIYVRYLPAGGDVQWMNITLVAVLEFRDLDMDGRYSLGDALEQRWPLEALTRPQVVRQSSEEKATATMTYRIPSAWNSRFVVTLAAEAEMPGRVLMTWQASDISYKTGNHTYVAVEVRIDGAVDLFGTGLRHPTATHALRWAWSDAVDNGTTLVKFGAASSQGAAAYFAQPAAFQVTMASRWNPSVLVIDEPPTIVARILGQWPAFLVGLMFAAVVVVGGARLSGGRI